MSSAPAWVLAGLATALMLSSGCHLFEERDDTPPADHEAELDPGTYAEQVDAKLRRISACRDTVASVIEDSWVRYADQVGPNGQPARQREGVYLRGINSNAFRTCRRVLEASATPPQMPVISTAVHNVVEAGTRYAALTRDLAIYLDLRQSRTEDWRRLAELDPELRIAHSTWVEADNALLRAIDLRHAENDAVFLGVLESRAEPLELASRRVMLRARPMVRCMAQAARASVEQCAARYDEFDSAVGEFDATYERERANADRVFWMRTFAQDVEEFAATAAAFQRRLAQRKLRAIDMQELIDGYSSLARDAETLDFDFP